MVYRWRCGTVIGFCESVESPIKAATTTWFWSFWLSKMEWCQKTQRDPSQVFRNYTKPIWRLCYCDKTPWDVGGNSEPDRGSGTTWWQFQDNFTDHLCWCTTTYNLKRKAHLSDRTQRLATFPTSSSIQVSWTCHFQWSSVQGNIAKRKKRTRSGKVQKRHDPVSFFWIFNNSFS